MKAAPIALAAALLATSGAAGAQAVNDARCILLSNAFAAEAKDAQAQKLAEASLYFYLGRLSPTETPAQLKTVFDQQSKTITETNAGPLMGDCVKAVQGKVELIQTLAAQAQPAPPQTTKPAPQPQGR